GVLSPAAHRKALPDRRLAGSREPPGDGLFPRSDGAGPMTTLDAFFAALRERPDDWLTRSALADWYEEAGLDRAAGCVRWMVRQGRRPHVNPAGQAIWFDTDRPLAHTAAA